MKHSKTEPTPERSQPFDIDKVFEQFQQDIQQFLQKEVPNRQQYNNMYGEEIALYYENATRYAIENAKNRTELLLGPLPLGLRAKMRIKQLLGIPTEAEQMTLNTYETQIRDFGSKLWKSYIRKFFQTKDIPSNLTPFQIANANPVDGQYGYLSYLEMLEIVMQNMEEIFHIPKDGLRTILTEELHQIETEWQQRGLSNAAYYDVTERIKKTREYFMK